MAAWRASPPIQKSAIFSLLRANYPANGEVVSGFQASPGMARDREVCLPFPVVRFFCLPHDPRRRLAFRSHTLRSRARRRSTEFAAAGLA